MPGHLARSVRVEHVVLDLRAESSGSALGIEFT